MDELLLIGCIIILIFLIRFQMKKFETMDHKLQAQLDLIQGLLENYNRNETAKTQLSQQTVETKDVKPVEEPMPAHHYGPSSSAFRGYQIYPQPLLEMELHGHDSGSDDIESLSDAIDEITSVSCSTTKEEIVKDSPQNWTDVPVQETMQDNRTFCHDDNNAQESLLNDSVDGNTRRTRGHEIQSLNIEDETKLSGHLKRPKETCKMIPSREHDHSRVQKGEMTKPHIKQSHQMKDPSQSHLEKRGKRKQAEKFGIPASDDAYYDKGVQEVFDDLQSDESNQNLGFNRTKSSKSNKKSPSQPNQRSQRYSINTDCDGNEGGYNEAAAKHGYCIDPALATETHNLASTGEPVEEAIFTCIRSKHGIDKCISCNIKRVHESLQEQNHK